MKVGVIAEEQNDVEVLYELTCKLTSANTFSFKKFVGHGCGKLRRKCAAWAGILAESGCRCLVVLHDCDNEDKGRLKKDLERRIATAQFEGRIVLIPVHEIEAWLLADAKAIQKVFTMTKAPRVPKNPETVADPKEKLRDIIYGATRKTYVNTIHNKRIAAAARISEVKRCLSFSAYPEFVNLYLKP